MANYLALVAGFEQEVAAAVTGGTAGQAGQIVSLDAGGRLDLSILPAGLSADAHVATASEALSAGAVVYLKADGTVANASATAGGRAAIGHVLTAVANGSQATIYFEGRNTGLSGLTVGASYFLGATAGTVSTSPIGAGVGNISQRVGVAVSDTTLATEYAEPIIRA